MRSASTTSSGARVRSPPSRTSSPPSTLPKEWLDLDYDQYRDIRFRPERALWRAQKLPFEVMFFHPGFHFERPVHISEVVGNEVREVPYAAADFDYGHNALKKTSVRFPGFAGFRVHYALNTPKYKDEVLVFLGASYFRALGKGQVYGLSARGLAVDTGLASGEEFPSFVEFWLVRPAPDANELTIYALLDSRARDRRLPVHRCTRAPTPRWTCASGCSCASASRASASRR